MGKFKQRQLIEKFARSHIGQFQGVESILDHRRDDTLAGAVRKRIYVRVLSSIHRMNPEKLTKIICCGERPAILKAERDGSFWHELMTGKINCPLDHVHYNISGSKPVESNWLADFEEKSGLEIIRHIAATVIVAAMYDEMNRRRNALPEAVATPIPATMAWKGLAE